MRCGCCGAELGHPDGYCPFCWQREPDPRQAEYEAAMREEYNRAMAEMWKEEMRDEGMTTGCA